MTASTGSQRGSLGKGRPQFGKPSYELFTQYSVIDLALHGTRAQHLLAGAVLSGMRLFRALEFGGLLILEAGHPSLVCMFLRHSIHHSGRTCGPKVVR